MVEWVPMVDVFPQEETIGEASLTHFTINKDTFQRPQDGYVPFGTYCRLRVNGALMMSDTRDEKRTNSDPVINSGGNMLIAGLGLGMVVTAIVKKQDPEMRLTVIEKSRDVIDLVWPKICAWGDEKQRAYTASHVTVIHGDIFAWEPQKNERYAYMFFDIWPDICTDDLKEHSTLHRRFGRKKTPDGKMNSWMHDTLVYQRGREKRKNIW